MMMVCPFAEGAELRLIEHHHAEELFALIDHNRSYLRQMVAGVGRAEISRRLQKGHQVVPRSIGGE